MIRNILFISYAYPPSSSPGSVRLSRIVARLSRSKFNPYVLTVGKRMTDREGGLADPLPSEQVIGVDDPLAKVASGSIVADSRKKRFSLKSLAQAFIFPDRTIFWTRRLRNVNARIDAIAPQVIVTSSPSLATHFAGRRLSKRTGAKWIAEFRDPASWLSQSDETSKFKRFLLSKIEAWVVKRADITITISEAFSEYFRNIYPNSNVRTVANGAEVDEAKITANVANVAKRTSEGPLNITHAGSLYGGIRNPEPLIAAAKLAQSKISRSITLHFIGGDSHLAILAAEKLGVPNMVVAHGSKGHDETVAMTEEAHGLVALLHDDPVARIGIMSKFFDYVATGNPVLVVGEAQAMLCRIVEDEGAGKAAEYGDIEGMVAWMEALANNPETMRPDALKICRKWSADTMASAMEQLFTEITEESA